MDNLIVNTNTNKYSIYFENSFDNLLKAFELSELQNRKVCIIADDNTKKFYSDEILKLLKSFYKDVSIFDFKSGEQNKNLNTIQHMYKFFLDNHLDRKSVIVALGGGVVGDMAGFAAATYMRGIKFVQIPTTVLAQVDSSVGGKVGVDFEGTKNIIGAFYQPTFVYINVNTVKTLPQREFSAGIAEAIKYGMIINKDYYEYINQNKTKLLNTDEQILKQIIKQCCAFKADIVSKDEKENGLRQILNFGHTIGHSIEALLNFKLIHGECVAIGMVAAAYICYNRKYISYTELQNFKSLLEYFKLPICVQNIDADKVYNQMFLDKKVSNNTISFILLNKIGEAFVTKDISKTEILEAIKYIIK